MINTMPKHVRVLVTLSLMLLSLVLFSMGILRFFSASNPFQMAQAEMLTFTGLAPLLMAFVFNMDKLTLPSSRGRTFNSWGLLFFLLVSLVCFFLSLVFLSEIGLSAAGGKAILSDLTVVLMFTFFALALLAALWLLIRHFSLLVGIIIYPFFVVFCYLDRYQSTAEACR